MGDHFSKYGPLRIVQAREPLNDAAAKAVVVFWVSYPSQLATAADEIERGKCRPLSCGPQQTRLYL
jgi:hypothetical protein